MSGGTDDRWFVSRRTLLATAMSIPLISGCLYDRWFDLEWDEEVLLNDGRVIVVHLSSPTSG